MFYRHTRTPCRGRLHAVSELRLPTLVRRASLAAGNGTLPRAGDGNAVGQRTAGDHDVPLVQIIPDLAENGEAVGTDPEGHGGFARVHNISPLARLRITPW